MVVPGVLMVCDR